MAVVGNVVGKEARLLESRDKKKREKVIGVIIS
jgi:hypothetical protein